MENLKTKLCTEGVIDTSLEEKDFSKDYNPLKEKDQDEIPSEKVFVRFG